MERTIYVIYNGLQDRPIICSGMYGSLIAFLTKEQAQAYLGSEPAEKNFYIKEITITI